VGSARSHDELDIRLARSHDELDIRLPLRLVDRAPIGLEQFVARLAYGRVDLLHRMDLRLPAPAGHEVLTVHDLACLQFSDEGDLPRRAGFGLPALEAMAVGTPVVAARRGALPEVSGDDAVLVEPDGQSIAGGVACVIDDVVRTADPVKRARARAATFTWERTARAHVSGDRDVMGI